MKKTIFAVSALAALSACTGQMPAEITQEPTVAAFTQNAPMDRIGQGTVKTTVRAYRAAVTEDGDAVRQEVVGAKCTLESDHIRAQVITPQEVVLPNYIQSGELEDRGVSPSILVSCSADDVRGNALLAAKPGEIVAGSGNFAADLILIAASSIAANVRDWRYEPFIEVDMK
ncbi:MAG: hypothetical protein ACWA40_02445 [Planktomarina sp.]